MSPLFCANCLARRSALGARLIEGVQNYNWLSKVVASRKVTIQFNAINLRDIDRGEGVSPSEYYPYTLQVTTGARRPRPYQLSVS